MSENLEEAVREALRKVKSAEKTLKAAQRLTGPVSNPDEWYPLAIAWAKVWEAEGILNDLIEY